MRINVLSTLEFPKIVYLAGHRIHLISAKRKRKYIQQKTLIYLNLDSIHLLNNYLIRTSFNPTVLLFDDYLTCTELEQINSKIGLRDIKIFEGKTSLLLALSRLVNSDLILKTN